MLKEAPQSHSTESALDSYSALMSAHVIWMSFRHVSSDSTHTTHVVCSVSPNCSSFAMSG